MIGHGKKKTNIDGGLAMFCYYSFLYIWDLKYSVEKLRFHEIKYRTQSPSDSGKDKYSNLALRYIKAHSFSAVSPHPTCTTDKIVPFEFISVLLFLDHIKYIIIKVKSSNDFFFNEIFLLWY